MEHFIINTTSGGCFHFDKRCNRLSYKDPIYLICKHENKNTEEIIALIPHSIVKSVIKCKV